MPGLYQFLAEFSQECELTLSAVPTVGDTDRFDLTLSVDGHRIYVLTLFAPRGRSTVFQSASHSTQYSLY